MKQYYTEETAKKLVRIGFYETVQYFKIKDKIYPKLPEPDELVAWLREHMNTYIVVMPDISKPLGHRFKYFVYTNDGCVVEGAHFNYHNATIDAIVEYLYNDEL
jgi:hypothetical protein